MAFISPVPSIFVMARAAAKASSWNGFGCARHVWPLQVLVCVWTTRALAYPVARGHVKLRQAGATPWALSALAANVGGVYYRFGITQNLIEI
jgi:hypothetical protein